MTDPTLDQRLDSLTAEVRRLAERVARLEADRPVADPAARVEASEEASSSVGAALSWGSASTVLSNTAVVCFLLVVALALRTLTDARLLAPAPGAGVGVAYSAALLGAGWAMRPRRESLASLTAACGSLLLCAVVVEAHRRLGVLAEPAAHGLLAGAGVALAALGRRGAVAPVWVGLPALLVAGVLVGVSFPGLAGVVLGATAAALSVSRRPTCGWLSWLVVAATAVLWATWAGRAAEQAGGGPGAPWYLPALAVFAVAHLAAAFRGAWASRPGVLDALVPSFTVGWAFSALAAPAPGTLGPAAVGVAAAGGLLLVAEAGAVRGDPGDPRIAAFANAAALLGLAVAASVASAAAAPLLAAAALGLALLAERWGSGGTRAGSYVLQGGVAVWAAASGAFAPTSGSVLAAAAAGGGAAALAFLHYRRCRSRPPPATSWYFRRLDRTDDTAVVVLLASLGLAFLAARAAVYPAMARAGDVASAFQGAQSVIVHLSAVGLGVAAYLRRDAEMRLVALLVTGIGGLKALLYDLLTLQGVALVASVLAFGGAAAVIAVLLRRWPRRAGEPPGSP